MFCLQGNLGSEEEDNDYYGKKEIDDPKIICSLSLLLTLFTACRLPSCRAAVDPANLTWSYSGAMITITTLCNDHHTTTWSSSPQVGCGKSKVATINILLWTMAYLCGVNVKKVTTKMFIICICFLILTCRCWNYSVVSE